MATNLYVNYIGQADLTLNGAIVAGDTSVNVTIPTVIATFGIVNPSGVGIYKVLIESEIVHFTAGTVTAGIRTWTLARGQEGTTAASHADGTILKLEATADALANAVQLSPTAQQTGNVNVSGSVTGGSLVIPHASTHDVGGSDVLKDLTRLAAGPAMHGYIAWNSDPEPALQAVIPTAGVIYLFKIMTAHAYTVNNIDFVLNTAGTGATALANCFIGIYDSGGTRRYVSADQSSNWATGGAKSISLGGSAYTVTANDFIYVALLVGTQSTTTVKFWGIQITANVRNVGLTAGTYRYAQSGTGAASLPTSLTLGSATELGQNGPWIGVK